MTRGRSGVTLSGIAMPNRYPNLNRHGCRNHLPAPAFAASKNMRSSSGEGAYEQSCAFTE